MMTQVRAAARGGATVAAWPLIPYMRANLRTKRDGAAQADAVIAVSTTIARDLRKRAPELAGTPVFTIPNPVDMTALDAADRVVGAHRPRVLTCCTPVSSRPTRACSFCCRRLQQSGLRLPVVVVGDGPLRDTLAAEARERGIDLRVLGWLDRGQVWAWMRHATMLAFPSYGPESLSRVLIEAAALGVPIAAMNTGGTRDILHDRATALLSGDVTGFARDLADLGADERLRAALGHAARADVQTRFSAASVVERIELVYRSLLEPKAA